MKWRIYYSDGSTYNGDPFEAPQVDVQAIAQGEPFIVMQGRDAYFWKDDRWNPCDVPGMWDYLMMHRGPKAVLFGRNVRDDLYWAAVGRATKEGVG